MAAANFAAAESVTVRPGDSLWAIAQRHATSVEAIMAANGLTGTTVDPGAVLALPADAAPSATTTWTVAVGDTLYEISRSTGATVDDLIAWNDLAGSVIKPGQVLRVAAGEPAPPAAVTTVQVGPGDTLWRIARAHDTTTADLAAANGISETTSVSEISRTGASA